jgi:hypothetical protein
MSEKLFALLLRLYPSSFRERYGVESLQLFHDRAQQEQGLYLQLRLWADILADFAVSMPREYRKAQPTLLVASAGQSSDGTPSFDLLENKPLRPEALASGALLSLVVLGASCLLILHAGDELPSASRAQHPPSAAPSSKERRRPAEKAIAKATEVPNMPRTTAKTQAASTSADPHSAYVPPNAPKQLDQAALIQPQASLQKTQASASVVSAPQTEAKLDSDERQLVIAAAIRNLKEYYFDPKIAEKTANALRAHQQRGEDSAAADGPAFAELLTRQMRDASQDMHPMPIGRGLA